MRAYALALLLALWAPGLARAQDEPTPDTENEAAAAEDEAAPDNRKPESPIPPDQLFPVRIVQDENRLIEPWRSKYLVRQAGLSPARVEEMMALRSTIIPEKPTPSTINTLMNLGGQLKEAETAKDKPRMKQIQAEIDRVMRQPNLDFLAAVRDRLQGDELAAFNTAVERLEDNPSGSLRPADLLRFARALDITPEQDAKLRAIREDYRLQFTRRGPHFEGNFEMKARMLSRIAIAIREVLTPEQREKFNARVDLARVDKLEDLDKMDGQITLSKSGRTMVQQNPRRPGNAKPAKPKPDENPTP